MIVWGCFSTSGVGNLVFIEGTLNKEGYLKIPRDNVLQSAEKMGLGHHFKFWQDNDPKHKSRLCKKWLLYRIPLNITPSATSPDLNPIENVWDELDRRVHERPISPIPELQERFQEEWAKLSLEYIQKLISSMPKRMRAIVDQKGGPTKY